MLNGASVIGHWVFIGLSTTPKGIIRVALTISSGVGNTGTLLKKLNGRIFSCGVVQLNSWIKLGTVLLVSTEVALGFMEPIVAPNKVFADIDGPNALIVGLLSSVGISSLGKAGGRSS